MKIVLRTHYRKIHPLCLQPAFLIQEQCNPPKLRLSVVLKFLQAVSSKVLLLLDASPLPMILTQAHIDASVGAAPTWAPDERLRGRQERKELVSDSAVLFRF